MKTLSIITAAMAGVALSATTSHAQMVSNGGGITPISSIYSGGAGSVSGSIDPSYSGTVGSTTQSGNLLSEVFLPGSGLTDPGIYTGVTFAYQVSETGNDFVDHISLSGFSLASVYIEYANSGMDTPAFASLTGGVLTIDFTPPGVQTGKTSDLVYVFTTSPYYAGNSATVDDGVSVNTTDLAPVPESNTIAAGALMLLPLGIGAIRAIRKERTA